MSSSKPCTIVVEGNIGSGKTTFLNHFKKFPIVSVLDEPISKWRDLKGHNLLVSNPLFHSTGVESEITQQITNVGFYSG